MGYEVTVFIGQLHTSPGLTDDAGRAWLQVFGVVETCKSGGDLPDLLRRKLKKLAYPANIFAPAGDGDTQINEDRYGEALVAYPITDVRELLTPEVMGDSRLLPWLKLMLENAPPVVTHCVLFGH